jgi:hypothetical protein
MKRFSLVLLATAAVAAVLSCRGATTPDLNVGALGIYGTVDNTTATFAAGAAGVTVPFDGDQFKVVTVSAGTTVTLVKTGMSAPAPADIRNIKVLILNSATNTVTWAADSGSINWISGPFNTSSASFYEFALYNGEIYGRQLGAAGNVRISTSQGNTVDGVISITNVAGITGASHWTNHGDDYLRTRPGVAANGVVITNLNVAQLFMNLGGNVWYGVLSSNLAAGMNELNPNNVNTLQLAGSSGTPTDSYVTLSGGNGPGSVLIVENYVGALGFCITNNTPLWDDPSNSILLPNGDWCPTIEGEQVWLRQNGHGDWVEVMRVVMNGSLVTNVYNNMTITNLTIAKGGRLVMETNTYITINGTNVAVVNPTDYRFPYRISTNVFGDGQWQYRPSNTNTLGFNSGDLFLTHSTGGGLGIGKNALAGATTPGLSVAIGEEAAQAASGGALGEFIAIGWQALESSASNYGGEVAIGARALRDKTSGIGNTALGWNVFENADSLSDSTGIGYSAGGALASGFENTLMGSYSLYAASSGNYITLYGFATGRFMTTPDAASGFGAYALYLTTTGQKQTAFGYRAGYTNTTGDGGLFIGYEANPASGALINVAAIGTHASVTNNNGFVLGNSTNDYYFPGASYRFDGDGTIVKNTGALLSVGDTTYVDLSKASQTNSVTGAITFAHATNGVHGLELTHARWFFTPSGGPHTLTIPATWRTNVYSAVPPALTNGTITVMYLKSGGGTADAASQTNCYVSFEYYK